MHGITPKNSNSQVIVKPSVFKFRVAKINQQAYLHRGGFQVIQNLSNMLRRKGLYGLKFYNDLIFDQYICKELTNRSSSKLNLKWYLRFSL